MELIYILVIPAAMACLSLIPKVKGRFTAGLTVLGTLAVLGLAVHTVWLVQSGTNVAGVHNWIVCDGFSALILVLVAFVGFTASIFSWGYTGKLGSRDESIRVHRYYVRYNLFLLSMLAVPLLSNVALVWIAVELTTLLSVFLVAFERTPEGLEAAWKYVVLTCMGAAIALFGVLILYWASHLGSGGPFTWAELGANAPEMPSVLINTAFMFILIGFGTKAGLVPMHTWLPDAHSQAPSPICALLSGVETSTALYAIIRVLAVVRTTPGNSMQTWAIVFGLISAGVAALLLIQVRDYKRLFAFSTIEHMGIILVATGIAGTSAHYGATYQIMSHAITKSFCFFATGAALAVVGTRDIGQVRGLIRLSPVAGVALLIGGLAISGAPPFAVFLSEFSILKAGLSAHEYIAISFLGLFIVIAFCAIMFHTSRMVFGKPLASVEKHALPRAYVVTLGIAVIPVVVLGLYMPGPLHNLLHLAAYSLGN